MGLLQNAEKYGNALNQRFITAFASPLLLFVTIPFYIELNFIIYFECYKNFLRFDHKAHIIHMKGIYKIICFFAVFSFFLFINISNIFGEKASETLASHWFLFPTSRIKNYSQIKKKQFRLLISPQLDLDEILKLAIQYEKAIALWLQNEKFSIYTELCSSPISEQKKKKQIYIRRERERQFLLWNKVHKNYVRSIQYYLMKRKQADKMDASLLRILYSAFSVLVEVQETRQLQILREWDNLIELSHKCELQKLTSYSFFPSIHTRELVRPHSLALYRFLRLFPVIERTRFLFFFWEKSEQ